LPLAEERFPIDEILFPLIVDNKAGESQNELVFGASVAGAPRDSPRAPSLIEIVHDGECVGPSPAQLRTRTPDPHLEHYLDVLEKKPGARLDRTPLEQWRQAGRWPDCLDRIWKKLEERHGKSGGTREMIGWCASVW